MGSSTTRFQATVGRTDLMLRIRKDSVTHPCREPPCQFDWWWLGRCPSALLSSNRPISFRRCRWPERLPESPCNKTCGQSLRYISLSLSEICRWSARHSHVVQTVSRIALNVRIQSFKDDKIPAKKLSWRYLWNVTSQFINDRAWQKDMKKVFTFNLSLIHKTKLI